MNIRIRAIIKTLVLLPINVVTVTLEYLLLLVRLPNDLFDLTYARMWIAENPEEVADFKNKIEKAINNKYDSDR